MVRENHNKKMFDALESVVMLMWPHVGLCVVLSRLFGRAELTPSLCTVLEGRQSKVNKYNLKDGVKYTAML